MTLASSTLSNFVNDAPESVECHNPYTSSLCPPANQISPSIVGIALKSKSPLVGKPVAAVSVKLTPPLVLT
ncbi:hypothetical protein D3C75_1189300 [compost metagenome]